MEKALVKNLEEKSCHNEGESFDYTKYSQKKVYGRFSNVIKRTEIESIKLCLISDYDIFGYQEFLEPNITHR